MNLTVFGATGGVGRELTQQAVEANHHVRAVVRSSSAHRVPAGADAMVIDDLLDREAVAKAVHGADVVLSAIGLRRRNPNNPWSAVTSPIDLTSRFAQLLVDVLPREPARLILVSAAGVGDSRATMSGVLRWMFDHSNVGVAYADLEKMEAVLRQSSLDWLAVRPVTLSNGKRSGRVNLLDRYGLFAKISRADVAGWMLDQLSRPTFGSRTPMIAGA